jgi:DNA-binding PadR family transcriptional regulator
MKILSKPEELILLTVLSLKDDAYGANIRNHIKKATGADWTIGAIYMPLNRLAKAGFLDTTIGEPTAERGGKRKKYYTLTSKGMKALAYTKRINDSMWANLSPLELKALKSAKQ